MDSYPMCSLVLNYKFWRPDIHNTTTTTTNLQCNMHVKDDCHKNSQPLKFVPKKSVLSNFIIKQNNLYLLPKPIICKLQHWMMVQTVCKLGWQKICTTTNSHRNRRKCYPMQSNVTWNSCPWQTNHCFSLVVGYTDLLQYVTSQLEQKTHPACTTDIMEHDF